MGWKVIESTQRVVAPEGVKAGVRCFSVTGDEVDFILTTVMVKEFAPKRWLADFYLEFPLDDDDAPEAFRQAFQKFKETCEVEQVISFNEDGDLEDIKSSGVLTKQGDIWVLVTASPDEVDWTRKLWEDSEFWNNPLKKEA